MKISIAVIGLTNLERIGIRKVASEIPGAELHDCRSLHILQESNFMPDAFVVDAETFLLNPAYFMPRRLQTAVVCRYSRKAFAVGDVAADDEAQPVMLFFDSDEPEIRKALESVVESAELCAASAQAEVSAREKEVIREVAAGLTNKEIADRLCISINTVITHRKNISQKLGIKSVSGLSRYALINGLL